MYKRQAQGLAESALRNIKYIEDLDYGNLVVSIKSSNVRMNYEAHKILKDKTDVPIHIGITEAGTPETVSYTHLDVYKRQLQR